MYLFMCIEADGKSRLKDVLSVHMLSLLIVVGMASSDFLATVEVEWLSTCEAVEKRRRLFKVLSTIIDCTAARHANNIRRKFLPLPRAPLPNVKCCKRNAIGLSKKTQTYTDNGKLLMTKIISWRLA